MRMVRNVPAWVRRPRLVVSVTEDFLLWLYGETGAPQALGSRAVLAWLGGIGDGASPMTRRPVEPVQVQALAEFAISYAISAGSPYPPAGWCERHGISVDVMPSRLFWEAHAGYKSTRSYALGVGMALGWVLGAIEDPTLMTPTYRDDGTTLSDSDREACAQVLRTLSVQPLPASSRPVLSPRPASVGRSWIS